MPSSKDTQHMTKSTHDEIDLPEVQYRRMPHDDQSRPAWRIRFELADDPSRAFGIDLNGEVTLGRSLKANADFIDLDPYGAEQKGVSRWHAILRPSDTQLYLIDLNSTNGTYRNRHTIGAQTPFAIYNNDLVSFGRLQFIIRIIDRPTMGEHNTLMRKASLADALSETAKAITSQLTPDAVLAQVAQSALAVVEASDIRVWLFDQQSENLYLEAQRSVDTRSLIRERSLANEGSLALQVARSGKSMRAVRKPGQTDPFRSDAKLEEGAMIFVPITLAKQTIGVLFARRKDPHKTFVERDEKVLSTIADFTAIAIQNARMHEVTDQALSQRLEELAALNELGRAVSSSLDLNRVHNVLMEQIRRHWDIEGAALWLTDRQTGAVVPFIDNREENPTLLGRGMIGTIAEQGTSRVMVSIDESKEFDASVDTTAGIKTYNMVGVPLWVADEVVGVLALFNKESGTFNEQDIERLEAFAKPVATAIQNARLFATSEHARAEAEHERAIVQATTQALTQPFMIFDEDGSLLIVNNAAREIMDISLAQEIEQLKQGVGETSEFVVGDKTYITTAEQVPYVGTVVMMQDITYVKQLERTRTELMHALSHDLKSPIASIQGWLELIDMVGLESERTPGFLEKIGVSNDRLLEMVSELLHTARSGLILQTHEGFCDMQAVVKSAIDDLQGAALGKSTELHFSVEGDPFPVWGDANHLYRCALNLIDNAIKYAPEESTVWISLVYRDSGLTFTVLDDGPGIPREDLPHVFERGYRGKQADGSEIGTGLGLATVKNIVEDHGGKVRADNHDEYGAEFSVLLPITRIEES